MPPRKLCNMFKNAKVSSLQMYQIDYFWSTWLLDASEGFCNLSEGWWPLVLQLPTLAVRVGGVGSEVAWFGLPRLLELPGQLGLPRPKQPKLGLPGLLGLLGWAA